MSAPAVVPKRACAVCARRKVKCNKGDPCSNCITSRVQCIYDAPAPPRPRKRAAEEELTRRLTQYENLMRKNNVDFTNHANIWVSSGREEQKDETSSEVAVQGTPTSVTTHPVRESSSASTPNSQLCRSLWTDLKSELQFPPTQLLRNPSDPIMIPTPPLHEILSSSQPDFRQLHPEPRHIYRMWHKFVESVDPIIKFIHVPTLQQRILDASWDPSKAPVTLAANMFAIYTLAVASMSPEECEAVLGESRVVLTTRYRTGTLKALVAADLFVTRDFDILRALVLYLFADPDSSLTLTLVSVAVKIAQILGIHREITDPKVSFFDKEMGIRLWWQLRGLEVRANATAVPLSKQPWYDFGDLRLPLNVNDVDLHPDMTDPPIEHTGPTEMLLALIKFEATHWIRTSKLGDSLFHSIRYGPIRGRPSLSIEDEALAELGKRYRDKFLNAIDENIPLHALAFHMTKRSGAAIRFKIHHPRGRAAHAGSEVMMTQAELDLLFDSALSSLAANDACDTKRYAPHLYVHITARFEMDAYIYILSELRIRSSGEQVQQAWKLVEQLFEEHPELIHNADNSFFLSLGDLALEAWEARYQALLREGGLREPNAIPQFIQQLREKRNSEKSKDIVQHMPDPFSDSFDALGSMEFYDLDWTYWNKFPQI